MTGVPVQNVPGNADASDQMSFIEKGVPSVQVFTGAHADYHRPTDVPEKIDATGLVRVADLVKEAVVYLLQREQPLIARIQTSPSTDHGSGMRRVLFGTVPDFAYQHGGVRVDSLVANSPAERAGLKPGDVILQLDGRKLDDLAAFSRLLKPMHPGPDRGSCRSARRQDKNVSSRTRKAIAGTWQLTSARHGHRNKHTESTHYMMALNG